MIRVRYPKRWDEKEPSSFYEGTAEELPDGTLKCTWEGINGSFVVDKSKVIIVEDKNDDPDVEAEVLALIDLMRTCNMRQIRLQLFADHPEKIGNLSRFALIRSFYEAAATQPKSEPPDEA